MLVTAFYGFRYIGGTTCYGFRTLLLGRSCAVFSIQNERGSMARRRTYAGVPSIPSTATTSLLPRLSVVTRHDTLPSACKHALPSLVDARRLNAVPHTHTYTCLRLTLAKPASLLPHYTVVHCLPCTLSLNFIRDLLYSSTSPSAMYRAISRLWRCRHCGRPYQHCFISAPVGCLTRAW